MKREHTEEEEEDRRGGTGPEEDRRRRPRPPSPVETGAGLSLKDPAAGGTSRNLEVPTETQQNLSRNIQQEHPEVSSHPRSDQLRSSSIR